MKVFVNTTSRDLAPYKSALKELLVELEHDVTFLDDISADDIPSQDVCKKAIQQNDVFIGVYANLYGNMRRGEETSVVEQLHRMAESHGKDILCYLLKDKASWPDKFQEDDFIKRSRLEAFQSYLSKNKKTARFSKPEDIVFDITPHLKKLSLVYDRQKHLYNWSSKLPANKKLSAIKALAERHGKGNMPTATFQSASALLATDFMSESPLPAALADDLESLLKGDIKANGVTASSKTGYGFWGSLQTFFKPVLAAAVLAALAMGYFIGTKMTPPAVKDVPIQMSDEQASQWFLTSRVEPNLTAGTFEESSARKALTGLRLAQSLPDQRPVTRYLDKLLAEIRSSNAGAADVSALENNKKLMQVLCDSLSLTAFCGELTTLDEQISGFATRSESTQQMQAITARAENRELMETERIAAYNELLTTFPDDIDKAKVNAQIDWLKTALKKREETEANQAAETARLEQVKADSIKAAASAEATTPEISETPVAQTEEPAVAAVTTDEPLEVEEEAPAPRDVPDNPAVKALIAQVGSDTLLINDALTAWQNLAATATGPAKTYAVDEVALLRDMLKKAANIKKDDDFFLSREFDLETKEGSGIGDRFNTGKIWMFARIFSPREETVTAQWISRGRVYHTSKANIKVSYGYRVFFSRIFYEGNIGPNEIRLFNEDGYLIARETFDIVTEPIIYPSDSTEAPAAVVPDSTGNGF
ncbi:MAG: DUF4062 domain-containing protein [Calditrichia bacterium]